MKENRDSSETYQGSRLIETARPGKGFFIKSRMRYYSEKDNKVHSRFSWEPVTVGDLWLDNRDGKFQMHFIAHRPDGSTLQFDQPVSRQLYTQFLGYKLDAYRADLIANVLRRNRTGLCVRKWPADKMLHLKVTERLLDELTVGSEKCGQSLNRYCNGLLSGKRPRAAFSKDELELLQGLKKSRADVQLQFNAMIAEFAHRSDEERLKAVISGKSYEWWREYLITALEFFDRMRDRVLNATD